MALYALFSPQKKISTVKIALRKSQGILADSDDSFTELMTVARKTLSLSFQHLGLVLGPALLSSFPLICIMAWSSSQFGHVFPEPGDQKGITLVSKRISFATHANMPIATFAHGQRSPTRFGALTIRGVKRLLRSDFSARIGLR